MSDGVSSLASIFAMSAAIVSMAFLCSSMSGSLTGAPRSLNVPQSPPSAGASLTLTTSAARFSSSLTSSGLESGPMDAIFSSFTFSFLFPLGVAAFFSFSDIMHLCLFRGTVITHLHV